MKTTLRNTIACSLLALLAQCSSSEKSDTGSQREVEALKTAYTKSVEHGDLDTATSLLNQLIATAPDDAATAKEELAKIHFAAQRPEICLKVLTDLANNHDRAQQIPLLEMTALCHEALGDKAQATAAWQVTFDKSQQASHAVRLAGLQVEQDQLDAAEQTIFAGFKTADVNSATIALPKSNTVLQRIPCSAALLNLKSLITLMRDPKATAQASSELTAALKIAPEYEIARRNLANLATPPPTSQ